MTTWKASDAVKEARAAVIVQCKRMEGAMRADGSYPYTFHESMLDALCDAVASSVAVPDEGRPTREFRCDCGELLRWAIQHEGNRQVVTCRCGIEYVGAPAVSGPGTGGEPDAWLVEGPGIVNGKAALLHGPGMDGILDVFRKYGITATPLSRTPSGTTLTWARLIQVLIDALQPGDVCSCAEMADAVLRELRSAAPATTLAAETIRDLTPAEVTKIAQECNRDGEHVTWRDREWVTGAWLRVQWSPTLRRILSACGGANAGSGT